MGAKSGCTSCTTKRRDSRSGAPPNSGKTRSGFVGEFRVSATVQGDEVLALVRDGALDGLSIGFRPIRDRWSKSRESVERLEVALSEVSVVATPAYDGARVHGVRAADRFIPLGEAAERLTALLKGRS